MKLRSRILLASGLLVVAPLLVLGIGIRAQMASRLTAEYNRRIETLTTIITEDLQAHGRDLAARLAALKNEIIDDNTFRLAVIEGRDDLRSDLLDYAGRSMTLMGLDMLQIQDARGRILSSGHFRNEFDRLEPGLPEHLAEVASGAVDGESGSDAGGIAVGMNGVASGGVSPASAGGATGGASWTTALVQARRPGQPFWALARVDSFRLAGQVFYVVGGFRVDEQFLANLARDSSLAVSLVFPGGAVSSDPRLQRALEPIGRDELDKPEIRLSPRHYLVRARDFPVVPPEPASLPPRTSGRLIVSHPLAPLQALLRNLDLWLLLVILATLAGSLILAGWISGRISRPLDDLARQTASLDLDRLEVDFSTDRRDEVGSLSRFLAAMTERLRGSLARLREAERRATLGELARQVNHDIRNGLTPIRNVVQHLEEVASGSPTDLARIFEERKGTLASGLAYLADLAANYARLAPGQKRQACSLNDIVRQVVVAQPALLEGHLQVRLTAELPPVLADPVGLRRIVENLVSNACESLPDGRGQVTISTAGVVASTVTDAATAGATAHGQATSGSATTPGAGSPSQVALMVADTGRGIPPEARDRIFTDFYTTKPSGTGLGLSIVRRLVADYEGTIRVNGPPTGGTIMTVMFPAAPTTPDVPASPAGPTGPAGAPAGTAPPIPIAGERQR